MHNIVKREMESGKFSVRKGQGRKPKLNSTASRILIKSISNITQSIISFRPKKYLRGVLYTKPMESLSHTFLLTDHGSPTAKKK